VELSVEGSLRNSKADKTSETQWTYEGEQRWKDEVVEQIKFIIPTSGKPWKVDKC